MVPSYLHMLTVMVPLRARRGAWHVAAIAFLMGGPGLSTGAPAAVALRGDAGAGAAGDFVANRPEIDIALRLDNDSPKELQVTLTPKAVRRAAGAPCAGADCALTLLLVTPGGPDTPLPFDEKTKVTIPQLGSKPLRLQGRLAGAGRYVVDLLVYEAGATTATSTPIAIKRERRTMPADSLQVGPGAQLTRPFLGALGAIDAIPLRIANPGDEQIGLDGVALALTRADAGGTFTQPVDWPGADVACFPAGLWPDGMPVAVKAGGSWTCPVHLPSSIGAGHYQLRVEPSGTDLGWTAATLDVKIRDPWPWPLLMLLIGAAGGTLVAGWTQGGRERLTLAITAQDQIEAFRRFNESMTDLGPDTAAAADLYERTLRDILETLRKNGDGAMEFGDRIDRIGAMLPLLVRFAALERKAQPFAAAVEPEYGEARAALRAADPDAAAARTALDHLEEKLKTLSAAVRSMNQESDPPPPQLFIFGWARGLSSRALRALQRRIDVAIALLSICFACLVGLVTLWSSDPTWGSLGNYLIALFTGLTFTIGGTVTLQQLAQTYQLGKITR